MFLSLLNKKEMLKFLDLAIYMVDIDGEPTQYEKRILNKMIAELDEIKDEYSFRLTDSVENTIDFFAHTNKVVKNVVYLNLVSAEKRRELISIVYAERDLREKANRIIKN